jgi:hypothetical protein
MKNVTNSETGIAGKKPDMNIDQSDSMEFEEWIHG